MSCFSRLRFSKCFSGQTGCEWRYDPKKQHCETRGAGNNWAHGYSSYGPVISPDVLENVNRSLERLDSHAGFLVTMSLAGGTGSGLGTFVSEQVRDSFPKSFMLSQVVWPFSSGEIILQDYNTMLSLSHLSQVSDGIVMFHNENIQNICEKRLRLPHVSFSEINNVISNHLLGVLLPRLGKDSTPNPMGDMLSHLCCHPSYKLLTAKCVPQLSKDVIPFTNTSWDMLAKNLRQMLMTDSSIDECLNWSMGTKNANCNKSLSNYVVSRGKSNDVEASSHKPKGIFQETHLYSNLLESTEALKHYRCEKQFNSIDKSMYLLSNCESPVASVDKLVEKCWKMFSVKAYLHQYKQFDVDESDFLDAFVTLESIVKAYSLL